MAPERQISTLKTDRSLSSQKVTLLRQMSQATGPFQGGLILPEGCQIAVTLRGRYHNPLANKEALRCLYEQEGLSISSIARHLKCSRKAATSALLRHGIPIREGFDGGSAPQGQKPFGYKTIRGKLVPHKAEQKIISWMLEEKKKGTSLRKILQELEKQNIRTKNGKRWHANTIRQILLQAGIAKSE